MVMQFAIVQYHFTKYSEAGEEVAGEVKVEGVGEGEGEKKED